jgi:hypothetical protein
MCKGNDLVLREQINTCELQNVCGLGMITFQHAVVCK